MFNSFGRFSQKRKKEFSLLVFFLLLFLIPVSAYFLISDYNFDKRTEAAIFNSLVAEMEDKIEGSEHIPGSIRLEFPDGVSNEEIEKIIGRRRNVPRELMDTPYERVEYVEVEVDKMAEEMARYERYTLAKEVDLNHIYHSFWQADGENRVLSNDWNSSNHWYFNNIKLPEVWKMQGCLEGSDTCGGSKSITVAIIDTGLALNAPEVQGMNLSPNTPGGMHDDVGHGTFVAGVIASTTNNTSSSVGMAHNVTILPIKANVPNQGYFSGQAIEQGIYYITKHGAKVLNMSFGTSNCRYNPSYKNALDHAYSQGVVLVAASGNDGLSCLGSPASFGNVISVGSVNANNARSSYSQYGGNLDFVAPVGQGQSSGTATWHQTCSPCRGAVGFANKYHVGTSFASPQLAGAAGLILSLNPSLTPAQVKDVLIKTVDDIGASGKDAQTGYGLLNLENIYKYFVPVCGELNGLEFEHTEENWPSSKFCSPGTVDPAEPVFPDLGGKTDWVCKGGDGSSVSCSASRKRPPEPVCGELNGVDFDPETTRWPSRNFCSGGVAEPTNPQFPSFGEATEWRCFESYDNSFVSCKASRKLAPLGACGELDGSRFLPDEEKWPSENFCSSGASSPRVPRFPAKGRIVEWKCVALDKKFVTCSAERGSCFSNSDCRSRLPYEVCVDHFCLRGDIVQDGKIDGLDFGAFKQDFLTFKERKWNSKLLRSDLNTDYKITMADYSIFVRTFRLFNKLD